jgi:phosphonate transport system permease protein
VGPFAGVQNVDVKPVEGACAAGGIGMQLSQRILINNWDQACFIILMMLATVAVLDFLSGRLRAKIIG